MAEKPYAVDGNGGAAMHDGDVVPRLHARGDEIDRFGIVLAQELQRAVREDDAEAPGRIGRILLEEANVVARMRGTSTAPKIEAARPAPQHAYAHARSRRARCRINAGQVL